MCVCVEFLVFGFDGGTYRKMSIKLKNLFGNGYVLMLVNIGFIEQEHRAAHTFLLE